MKRHSGSELHDVYFYFISLIGKLNYLEKGSLPDVAYIIHQFARIKSAHNKDHAQALRWLIRYLKGTRDKVTLLIPKTGNNLEVYVDADFYGNWDKDESLYRDTACSRNGYIIIYAACPFMWKP